MQSTVSQHPHAGAVSQSDRTQIPNYSMPHVIFNLDKARRFYSTQCHLVSKELKTITTEYWNEQDYPQSLWVLDSKEPVMPDVL